MDLMTLAAKLTLDDSGFQSGINNAESAGEKLSGKLSAMTVAVGNIMSNLITQGYNTVKNVITGAVDAYANYEQLIGGVETLFKTSSGKVQQYAQQAYKTAGLSSNEYMETVTSFSASLLQGLKGDTEAAAELVNLAITDMSDNANKMGTDISSIQTAYQGFAKQNYTMLDNLKLGYGGTADEMVRLVNDSGVLDTEITSLDGITFDQLVSAIHAVQTEMGITGTTAKEAASTIGGSKNSLKAAWNDMLSAVGGEGDQTRLDTAMENFKTSFSTYMEQFLPTLVTTIVNSGSLVTTIAESVASLPTDTLSKIAQGVFGLAEGTADGAKSLVTWIIDSITVMFKDIKADPSKITEMGQAIGEFIGSALSDIIENAPTIISGLFTAGVSLASSLIEGLFSGLFGSDEGVSAIFADADEDMSKAIKDAESSSIKANGIIEYMDSLVKKYGDSASNTEEWAKALEHLEQVMPGATEYINKQNGSLSTTVKNLKEMNEQLRQQAVENAKQKALETKYQAWVDAIDAYTDKKTEIEMAEGAKTDAAEKLGSWFNSVYEQNGTDWKFNASEWENDPAGLRTEVERLLNFYAKDSEGNAYDQDSEEYKVLKAQLLAWADSMTGTDEDIDGMKDELSKLEDEMILAEVKYKTSAEQIEKMTSATKSATSAISTWATSIFASLGGGNSGDSSGTSYTPEATGLEYVPYDGYKVELHKGEAVLTKEENAARNTTTDYAIVSAQLEEAIESAMSRMQINMSGEKVGDLTTKRVNNNISSDEHTRIRALGG